MASSVNVLAAGKIVDANFPKDLEGRVYHLSVKKGEVNNRILSVGSLSRAESISKRLDTLDFSIVSSRGFSVYSGTYKGVSLSIVGTGMGCPMMDFVIRECRAVVDGPMVIIRFGTCGGLLKDVPVGYFSVASSSIKIDRNPDAFDEHGQRIAGEAAYRFSRPVQPDQRLTELLKSQLEIVADSKFPVLAGLNSTACSFYSSQGRIDSAFNDDNADLISDLTQRHPDAATLEMETFHLLDLARCSRGTIRAAASTLVIAQRRTNDVLDTETYHLIEGLGGLAALNTLAAFDLDQA